MISLVKPDDRPVAGTVDVFEIYSRADLYTAYFEDSRIPEKIGDEFFMGGTNILKFYYGPNCSDPNVKRRRKLSTLNRYVRRRKFPVLYIRAYAMYESCNINHTLADIRSEEIKNCECYKLASKLLKEAKYFIRRDGKKVILNDN